MIPSLFRAPTRFNTLLESPTFLGPVIITSTLYNFVAASPRESVANFLFFRSLDLLRNFGFVAFLKIFGKFSVLFWGVISTCVYYPPKKNRKFAQKVWKIDRTEVTQEVCWLGDKDFPLQHW